MCVCLSCLGLLSLCFDTVKLTAAPSNVHVRLLKPAWMQGARFLHCCDVQGLFFFSFFLWRNGLQQLLTSQCDVWSCDAKVVCPFFLLLRRLCCLCNSHTTKQGTKRLYLLFFFPCLVIGQKCDVYNWWCYGHYNFTFMYSTEWLRSRFFAHRGRMHETTCCCCFHVKQFIFLHPLLSLKVSLVQSRLKSLYCSGRIRLHLKAPHAKHAQTGLQHLT